MGSKTSAMSERPNLGAILRRADKVLAGERLTVMDVDLFGRKRKRLDEELPSDKEHKANTTGGKRSVAIRDMATLSERVRLYWRQIQLNEMLASKMHKENGDLAKLNAGLNENVKTLKKDLAFADWKLGNMATEIKHLNTTIQNHRKSVDEANVVTAKLRENYKKLQQTDSNQAEQLNKLKCELREKELLVIRLEALLVSGQQQQQQVGSDQKEDETKHTNGYDVKQQLEHVKMELAGSDHVLKQEEEEGEVAIDSPPWVAWSPAPPPPPMREQSPPYEPFTF